MGDYLDPGQNRGVAGLPIAQVVDGSILGALVVVVLQDGGDGLRVEFEFLDGLK